MSVSILSNAREILVNLRTGQLEDRTGTREALKSLFTISNHLGRHMAVRREAELLDIIPIRIRA